ncbi:MAG: mechanosensitive ion channel family protein, partial [Bacteroidetes bacterium]
GIGYDDDIDKAKEVLMSIIKANNNILQNPEPFIGVSELADSSVNFAVRVWVKGEDYWDVFFAMNETVKKEFDKQSISIPYPQTDVHIFQNKPA